MVNEQRRLHLSFALGFYRDAVCHSHIWIEEFLAHPTFEARSWGF